MVQNQFQQPAPVQQQQFQQPQMMPQQQQQMIPQMQQQQFGHPGFNGSYIDPGRMTPGGVHPMMNNPYAPQVPERPLSRTGSAMSGHMSDYGGPAGYPAQPGHYGGHMFGGAPGYPGGYPGYPPNPYGYPPNPYDPYSRLPPQYR
jgi:hypothetical protein